MRYDNGFGVLENSLIDLFRSGAPDFDDAEKLIEQGADVNAIGKELDENVLSNILMGYWQSKHSTNKFIEEVKRNDWTVCDIIG